MIAQIIAVKQLLLSMWIMIKSTHRHPANRALHIAGSPLYVIGIYLVSNIIHGSSADSVLGGLLWSASVAMFTIGHLIEGNLNSITPVLAYRLFSRKLRGYFVPNRFHVQAA